MSNITTIQATNYTPEQMKLITDVVARGATKDELELFLYRCKKLGLDPLKPGQIYFIKYGNSPGTIIIGIEGFRARAAKTGKLNGIKRGALRGADGSLIGAFAEVYRSDWKECAREEVSLSEYSTGKNNWAKMPETMIKKVAEAAALRMAFPDDLGGVYTKEEMEQAEVPHNPHAAKNNQPAPQDGIQMQLPQCRCGKELKFTKSSKSGLYPNGCWFCPDFKNKGVKHEEPFHPEDYAQWKQEIINELVAKASEPDFEESM